MAKVLVLSPYSGALHEGLVNDDVDTTDDAPGPQIWSGYDWLISYGYRHILRQPVLKAYPERIVNLHISMLPWGRGADPNFWAWLCAEPHGVTVHLIDAGIDTGPILAQREVSFPANATLATSYATLRTELERLFAEIWPSIRNGRPAGTTQMPGGSFHRVSDKTEIMKRLPQGWNTPVSEIANLGRQLGLR